MRKVNVNEIVDLVKEAVIRANTELGEDVEDALKEALKKEKSPFGKEILEQIILNSNIAKKEKIPICQDTGIVIIFAEIGCELKIEGDLYSALEEGVKKGYKEGYLRMSVCHPLSRRNTQSNTPVFFHTEIVKGDRLRMWIMTKGGGAENMSRLYMLLPTEGWEGIKKRIIETVVEAGARACPPLIVGVGIGGSFETAPILAKKALLRKTGEPSPDPEIAKMEKEVLEDLNRTGIGPQGLGGTVTALAVHINMMPCHIASLPVAVNLQCHAHRKIFLEI